MPRIDDRRDDTGRGLRRYRSTFAALGAAVLALVGCVPDTTPPPPGPGDPTAHYVLLPGVVGMKGRGFDFVMVAGSAGNTAAARSQVQSVVDELNAKTGSSHRLLSGTSSGAAAPNQVLIRGVASATTYCGQTAIGCASPTLQGGYVVGGSVAYEGGLETNRQLFAHEIGHALGLAHCVPNPDQIMCNSRDLLTEYQTGDINGFRWLLTQQPPTAQAVVGRMPVQADPVS